MVKQNIHTHWLEAVRLCNEYKVQKLLGATHKKLHNIDREMRFHLSKVVGMK